MEKEKLRHHDKPILTEDVPLQTINEKKVYHPTGDLHASQNMMMDDEDEAADNFFNQYEN